MHQLKHHEDLMMYFRDAFKIQSKIYDGAFLSLPLHLMKNLKVKSYKLHDNKYMTASAQITSVEIVTFIAVLVFKVLSPKVLLKK